MTVHGCLTTPCPVCTPRPGAAEVERLTAERDAYRKAKQENDERFMLERDAARAEVERLRAGMRLHGHTEGLPCHHLYSRCFPTDESLREYRIRQREHGARVATARAEKAEAERDELRAEINRLTTDCDVYQALLEEIRDQRDALTLQVARVEALHVRDFDADYPDDAWCSHCAELTSIDDAWKDVVWPCATTRALRGETP